MLLLLCISVGPGSTAGAGVPGGRFEVNALEYPWSTIGRVNAAGRGYCTGFLVSERHVMTAAHCLYNFTEGRWLAPLELHFVAGYQRDQYPINAPVVSYDRSSLFQRPPTPVLDSVPLDWALLTLAEPIGRQAGWLGIKALTHDVFEMTERGEAILLQAGYRADRQHIMTASQRCKITGFFKKGRGFAHRCDIMRGDSGSPLLMFADGAFFAAGIHSIDFQRDGTSYAGVVSLTVFHPELGRPEAADSLRRAAIAWGPGNLPAAGSPTATTPLDTIDTLLRLHGLLPAEPKSVSDSMRSEAIHNFSIRHSLSQAAKPSLKLLQQLIRTLP